jgi:TonB family protein
MGKVVAKFFDGPFGINHAAIISIVVHAIFLSTQPLNFLDKPPVMGKKNKEVRLDFVKRTKVIPVIKKVVDVRKPFLRKINNPVYPKPIPQAVSDPVKQILSQPLTIRPKLVETVSRPSQIALPTIPTIQKLHNDKFVSKSIFSNFNIDANPKSTSDFLKESKISRSKKLEITGSRTILFKKNFKPRTIEKIVEGEDTKDIIASNYVKTRESINHLIKIQARHAHMFLPEQQENPLSDAELKKLWAGYTNAVRKMIAEAKVYPPSARDKGQEGKIGLSFKLGKHGELLKLLIENSSGNNVLDDAARNAVKSAGPFPPIPEKLNQQYVLLELPISFVLR